MKEKEEREIIEKEIDAALGTSLSQKKRRKVESKEEKRKFRYARLTNIKKEKSSKTLLHKKVFSKRSMTKIAESFESGSKKKQEKFRCNFNYR